MKANDKFNPAASGKAAKRPRFNSAFDTLTSNIWFGSEAESILPENVEKTKAAFRKFLTDMDMPLAVWNFDELLEEKKGEFEFRADGKTPNWYHEFRECLIFMSYVRSGLIREKDLEPYGGLQVAMATILRHDSWEDLGKGRMAIYTPMEKRLHEMEAAGLISEKELFALRQKAVQITDNVDLLTRKAPRRDENGNFVRKPSGKLVKDDRFGEQLNLYYDQIIKNPITLIAKFIDGIEGMSTRIGVGSFDLTANVGYTAERRMLYGTRALDKEGTYKFPFLHKAIRSADSALGVLLVTMETVNHYDPAGKQHPRHAKPINIEKYIKDADAGLSHLPPAFHPVCIAVERLRILAEVERMDAKQTWMQQLLSNALIPALSPAFPKLNAYLQRGLQGQAPSALNQG